MQISLSMKKTFLAKRNALISSTTGVSWGLAVLVVALFLVGIRFLAPNTFLHIVTPLFTITSEVRKDIRFFVDGFKNTAILAERNTQLVYENQALAFENQILEERLQDLGGVDGAPLPEGIIAGVLTRPPESPYDTLILSSGSLRGAEEGMRVFSVGGVPLGTISSATEDFSRVTLFSAPGVVTEGWIGAERVPITIRGSGGGAVETVIPRSVEVQVGDLVFAPGPGALPFGTIVGMDDNPSSPEVVLNIMPAVNIYSLTWVTVRDAGRSR
jgi:cell shape-determining protein MreC